ncbi:MAG: hemolysin family protein [Bacteroidota bacterium]|nr:hemolysin family protein [Bacteroidota bacterium]
MEALLAVGFLILTFSFLASSAEAALFTVSPLQVERLCRDKRKGAQSLRRNKEHISDSIIAIVILNNLSNITGSVLIGNIAGEMFGDVALGVFTGIFTFLIILAGEIVPKTIGERYAEKYALRTAWFVGMLRVAFAPFVALIRGMLIPLGGGTTPHNRVSEDEITLLAHIGRRHGTILDSEDRLIRNVFRLNDIIARDIMTPRTVIFALPAKKSLADAAADLFAASVSRIPLYEEDLDTITGVAHIRDLLSALARGLGDRPLSAYADRPLFVPDTARTDALLSLFQKNRTHLAVVVDEFGGTAGVITLEDILEQLVGEIVDEHDRDVDLRVKARSLQERRYRE